MGVNHIKISFPDHKLSAFCLKDCNPSLNLDGFCNGACFQICPLLCKTFSFQDILPPIPPIPPIPQVPPLILRRTQTETGNISQPSTIVIIMIIIAAVLGAAIIFCIFFCFLSFYVKRRRETTRERTPPVFFGTQEDFIDEDQWPEMDHHIWYINSVGLQPSVIDLITVFKYKKDESVVEGTDCAVCLSEFEEDESLKLLPKCSHAFHIPCIDTWLTSHKNCPLCRAPIVANDFDTQVSLVIPADSNSSSSTEGEEGTSEARNEDDSGCSVLQEDEPISTNSAMKLNVPKMSGLNNNNVNKRSLSFDSSSATTIRGSVSSRKMVKSSSIGHVLQKGPISMKRSFSSAAKTWPSRYSRSHDSILPL